MRTSVKGLIEIVSHEGICLKPYLDSVNVWTIGVGRTAHDGRDPRSFGEITLDQAIQLFREDIVKYERPVQALPHKFNQHQFDALVSACYNFGEGNLRKLASGRTVEQIGEALMLYRKPPEIISRRQKEQNLYKYGKYTSNGKVPLFPVGANNRPIYSKATLVDVTPYFYLDDPGMTYDGEGVDAPGGRNLLVILIRAILSLFRK